MLPPNSFDPARIAPSQYNWLQRLAARFLGLPLDAIVAQQAAPSPTVDLVNEPAVLQQLHAWDQAMSLENRTRLARYQEYNDLDYGDIASQLDAIVDAVLVGDDPREKQFKVDALGNRNIKNLIEDTLEKTGLQFKARQILRDTLKYGDCPVALWFEDNGGTLNVIGVQNLDAYYMLRRTDLYGRLLGGTEKRQVNGRTVDFPRAYHQVNPLSQSLTGATYSSDPINGWLPWQLCWLKWRENDRYRYSHGSYLEDMRRDALKLRYQEASMVVARGTRAYPRRVFKSDLTGKGREDKLKSLSEFRKMMTEGELYAQDSAGNITAGPRRKSPLEVDQDLYIGTGYLKGPDGKMYPALDGVDLEDPRIEGLNAISDVMYFREKQYRRTSKGMMGVESASDLTIQDVAFAKMCRNLGSLLSDSLIFPILRLQCLLRGYTLEDKDIRIIYPMDQVRASWRHADAGFRAAMARANDLKSGTLSVRSVLRNEDHLTEEEIDLRFQEVATEMQLRKEGKLPSLDKGKPAKDGDGANGPPDIGQVRGGNQSA